MILTILAVLIACLAKISAQAEKNNVLLGIFRISVSETGETTWEENFTFKKTLIQYNNCNITAYYTESHVLVGFSKRIDSNAIPEPMKILLHHNFKNCSVCDAIVFINSEGDINYYIGLHHAKKYVAIKLISTCKVESIKKIHINKILATCSYALN